MRQRSLYIAPSVEKRPSHSKKEQVAPGAPVSLLELATGNRFQRDHGESRILEGADGMKYVQPKVNKTIYVRGLPTDVTEEEMVSFFSRAGVLKKDPTTRTETFKLYKDENGHYKGDGLVSFFRAESVAQAFKLLHEAHIRPGFPVLIEEAKFKLEPGTTVKTSRRRGKRKRNQQDPSKAGHSNGANDVKDEDDVSMHSGDEDDENEDREEVTESGSSNAKHSAEVKTSTTTTTTNPAAVSSTSAKIPLKELKPMIPKKKKKLYDQNEELGWEEKEQKHIILKHVFRPEQAFGSITFYDELKEEIMEEAKKLGHVESVKVFERSSLGVVAIKFSTSSAAEKCLSLMNGRIFDGNRIAAEYYDGFTNYTVSEKEDEVAARDSNWADWLESDKS